MVGGPTARVGVALQHLSSRGVYTNKIGLNVREEVGGNEFPCLRMFGEVPNMAKRKKISPLER